MYLELEAYTLGLVLVLLCKLQLLLPRVPRKPHGYKTGCVGSCSWTQSAVCSPALWQTSRVEHLMRKKGLFRLMVPGVSVHGQLAPWVGSCGRWTAWLTEPGSREERSGVTPSWKSHPALTLWLALPLKGPTKPSPWTLGELQVQACLYAMMCLLRQVPSLYFHI